jgi:hypothetical protein
MFVCFCKLILSNKLDLFEATCFITDPKVSYKTCHDVKPIRKWIMNGYLMDSRDLMDLMDFCETSKNRSDTKKVFKVQMDEKSFKFWNTRIWCLKRPSLARINTLRREY